MKLVVDSNIFIAGLLKESKVRELIVNSKDELFIPEIVFEEINKHKRELVEKSGLSREEFDLIISKLVRYVTIVPTEKITSFKLEAESIIGSIDENDVPFIATSLAFNCCPVWSDDKHFKQQEKIEVYSTAEVIDKFYYE